MGRYDGEDYPEPERVVVSCGYGKHLRGRNNMCQRRSCGVYVGDDGSPWAPGDDPRDRLAAIQARNANRKADY